MVTSKERVLQNAVAGRQYLHQPVFTEFYVSTVWSYSRKAIDRIMKELDDSFLHLEPKDRPEFIYDADFHLIRVTCRSFLEEKVGDRYDEIAHEVEAEALDPTESDVVDANGLIKDEFRNEWIKGLSHTATADEDAKLRNQHALPKAFAEYPFSKIWLDIENEPPSCTIVPCLLKTEQEVEQLRRETGISEFSYNVGRRQVYLGAESEAAINEAVRRLKTLLEYAKTKATKTLLHGVSHLWYTADYKDPDFLGGGVTADARYLANFDKKLLPTTLLQPETVNAGGYKLTYMKGIQFRLCRYDKRKGVVVSKCGPEIPSLPHKKPYRIRDRPQVTLKVADDLRNPKLNASVAGVTHCSRPGSTVADLVHNIDVGQWIQDVSGTPQPVQEGTQVSQSELALSPPSCFTCVATSGQDEPLDFHALDPMIANLNNKLEDTERNFQRKYCKSIVGDSTGSARSVPFASTFAKRNERPTLELNELRPSDMMAACVENGELLPLEIFGYRPEHDAFMQQRPPKNSNQTVTSSTALRQNSNQSACSRKPTPSVWQARSAASAHFTMQKPVSSQPHCCNGPCADLLDLSDVGLPQQHSHLTSPPGLSCDTPCLIPEPFTTSTKAQASSHEQFVSFNQAKRAGGTHETMRQKTPRGEADGTESFHSSSFSKDVEDALSALLAVTPYKRRDISLRLELGRIILAGIDESGLSFNSPESESNGWSKQEGLKKLNEGFYDDQTLHFTRVLTTYGGDMEQLTQIKDGQKRNLWNEKADGYSTVYVFMCSFKGTDPNRRFYVEITDAGDGGFDVAFREPDSMVDTVWLHDLTQNWDALFRLSYQALDFGYSEFGDKLLKSLEVKGDADIRFSVSRSSKIAVESVRMLAKWRHNSPSRSSSLDITEVRLLCLEEFRDAFRSADEMVMQARPVSEAQRKEWESKGKFDIWYEASIASRAIEALLEQNLKLGIGCKAEWDFEHLKERGFLADLYRPALAMLKHMNDVGSENDNGQMQKLKHLFPRPNDRLSGPPGLALEEEIGIQVGVKAISRRRPLPGTLQEDENDGAQRASSNQGAQQNPPLRARSQATVVSKGFRGRAPPHPYPVSKQDEPGFW